MADKSEKIIFSLGWKYHLSTYLRDFPFLYVHPKRVVGFLMVMLSFAQKITHQKFIKSWILEMHLLKMIIDSIVVSGSPI